MFSGLRKRAPEAPEHGVAQECAVDRFPSVSISLPHMTTRGNIAMQARMGLSLRKQTLIAITAHDHRNSLHDCNAPFKHPQRDH